VRPGQVTLPVLRDYQWALLTGEGAPRGRPLAASTVAKITTALRAFFAFLADGELIPANPAARLDRPKLPRKLPGDVLNLNEIQRLLTAPGTTPLGLRDRALLELLYATGLRRAEACSLNLADLDHREREVRVHEGKGGKSRIVPLTRSAYERVHHYLEFGRPQLLTNHRDSASALFLSGWGQRIKWTGLWRGIKGAARQAKLDKRVTPHSLRRTVATHLLKGGASLRHIQLLLGHASPETTALYQRIDGGDLRREVLLHHPREQFGV
jgi:integrase/recombinase XerD